MLIPTPVTISKDILIHDFTINKKNKTVLFRQKTIPKFNSFASAIPIMIFLPHR